MTAASPTPARDYAKAYRDAVAASQTVAEGAPCLFDLGVHLADAKKAYDAWDEAGVAGCTDPTDRLRLHGAKEIAGYRVEALHELIATMPARSIADAAVVVAECITIAARLSASVHTEAQVEVAADKLERMLLGALPFLAQVAGLDMARMDWADTDALRPHRFAGVGVTS